MDCMWRDGCTEVDGGPAKAWNRGLCVKHYSRARTAGTLDSYDPSAGRVCEVCGESLAGRRAGSRFCSSPCKETARVEALRASRKADRSDLSCGWCRGPIDPSKRATKFCSVGCKDKEKNHTEAVLRERARKAERQPCGFCGGKIPSHKPARAKFCSMRCKDAAHHRPNEARRQRMRDYMLTYTRGITVEEYNALLEAQGGCCAICGADNPQDGRVTRFHVDHCHQTGENRGLLCHPCNLGLGKFRDDPDKLRAAADYIESHGGGRRVAVAVIEPAPETSLDVIPPEYGAPDPLWPGGKHESW